jgi:SAM-dependent MidA family methyltransferase
MALNRIISIINSSPEGCISFEEYMELCLYHPEDGYYSKVKQKIGRQGDFYTSSSVSPVFGYVWSDVFRETISSNELQASFIEAGAGNGDFASHVLSRWREEDPAGYLALTYHIVEGSPFHREVLQRKLSEHKNVSVHDSFKSLMQCTENFKGIVFANELLDALPVKVLRNNSGVLEEMFVCLSNGALAENWKRAENVASTSAGARLIQYGDGWRGELPLQMEKWLKNLYEWIDNGSVVYFADYGYRPEEWMSSQLREGSIRGYRSHQLVTNLLAFPGEMDLTAHVDWEAVLNIGKLSGMEGVFLMGQGRFLMENGILRYLAEHDGSDPFSKESKMNRAIRSFLLNSGLEEGFQVAKLVKN